MRQRQSARSPAPAGGVRGFALNEVLLAVAILAVALIAVSAMFLFASSNVDYSGGAYQATALAQRRLEQMRNLPFATLAGMVTATNPPDLPPSSEEVVVGADQTTFTVRTWVQLVPGTAAPRREATTTVVVSWMESVGGAKAFRLDTLMAE